MICVLTRFVTLCSNTALDSSIGVKGCGWKYCSGSSKLRLWCLFYLINRLSNAICGRSGCKACRPCWEWRLWRDTWFVHPRTWRAHVIMFCSCHLSSHLYVCNNHVNDLRQPRWFVGICRNVWSLFEHVTQTVFAIRPQHTKWNGYTHVLGCSLLTVGAVKSCAQDCCILGYYAVSADVESPKFRRYYGPPQRRAST